MRYLVVFGCLDYEHAKRIFETHGAPAAVAEVDGGGRLGSVNWLNQTIDNKHHGDLAYMIQCAAADIAAADEAQGNVVEDTTEGGLRAMAVGMNNDLAKK